MASAVEMRLQAQCAQWFWNTYPSERRMLIHVDNNSSNAIEGNRKKAMGVVRGPSDFIFIVEQAVIFIELKTESGAQKPEQIDFMEKVMDRGHSYIIVRDFETFKSIIWQAMKKTTGK